MWGYPPWKLTETGVFKGDSALGVYWECMGSASVVHEECMLTVFIVHGLRNGYAGFRHARGNTGSGRVQVLFGHG